MKNACLYNTVLKELYSIILYSFIKLLTMPSFPRAIPSTCMHTSSADETCSTQEWRDDSLRWDPAQHGGIEHMYVPAEDIWHPDIVLYNKCVAVSFAVISVPCNYTYMLSLKWRWEVRNDETNEGDCVLRRSRQLATPRQLQVELLHRCQVLPVRRAVLSARVRLLDLRRQRGEKSSN